MSAWHSLIRLSLALFWLSALTSAAKAESAQTEAKGAEDSAAEDEVVEGQGASSVVLTTDVLLNEKTEEPDNAEIPVQPSMSPLVEEMSLPEVEHITTLPSWQIDSQIEEGEDNQAFLASLPEVSVSAADDFVVFPVGLNVGDRNIVPTVLIKGIESNQPTEFTQWLIPFDSVMQALDITSTTLENGDWELRSPSAVIQVSPSSFQIDPDIGLALSVSEIESLLGISATFDQLDYAIRFSPPPSRSERVEPTVEQPVSVAGLPLVEPVPFSLSGVAQEVTFSGNSDGEIQSRGTVSSVGSAFGGSWYVRTQQPELGNTSSWRLNEFQYLRQTDEADTVVGSQPTFWRSQNSSDYWGATYLQRWGFQPPENSGNSGFNPRQRLQAAVIGRTITGEAPPGTLVQLTQGFRNVVVEEVLVDSSGLYQFDNVSAQSGRYQVLLYPDGQLTSIPEIQSASFSTLPGQLPSGASALLVSSGVGRQTNDSFVGEFSDFRGGFAYRRGLTEDLTVGAGLVQDGTTQVLSEAFYAPDNLPVKVAVSALSDLQTAEVDVTANVQVRPSANTYFNFNSDRFSQRFDAEWRVSKGLTLLARGNSRDGAIAAGARFSVNNRNFSLSGNATLDTKNRARWDLSSRWGAMGLRHYGNEITTQSELSYNLSNDYAYAEGHSLLLSHETRRLNNVNRQLSALSWRYRSEEKTNDGRFLWNAQLGYGVGSEGTGIVASLSTAILPGVDVQARYQGISAVSDESSFQIGIVPRLNTQRGIRPDSPDQDRLRTRGGLLIQPFLDENNNGKRDSGESIYHENSDLLLSINHSELNQYRPDNRAEGLFLTLPPDTYRLDLDPAGFPLDWQASQAAYAVSTTAGQFTSVEIPFTRAYTLIGRVTDIQGEAIAGQRVDAIALHSEKSQRSVTNSAGVFYIEGLPQGEYRFEINGESVEDGSLDLQEVTEGLQEINFQVMPDGVQVERLSPEVVTL